LNSTLKSFLHPEKYPEIQEFKKNEENKEIHQLLINYYKQLGIYDPKIEQMAAAHAQYMGQLPSAPLQENRFVSTFYNKFPKHKDGSLSVTPEAVKFFGDHVPKTVAVQKEVKNGD